MIDSSISAPGTLAPAEPSSSNKQSSETPWKYRCIWNFGSSCWVFIFQQGTIWNYYTSTWKYRRKTHRYNRWSKVSKRKSNNSSVQQNNSKTYHEERVKLRQKKGQNARMPRGRLEELVKQVKLEYRLTDKDEINISTIQSRFCKSKGTSKGLFVILKKDPYLHLNW